MRFSWKPFLVGIFSGLFFGVLGLSFGFFSSGFFSPFSRPGVDIDYEASSVVFFSLGLCFGSVFGSVFSLKGVRKGALISRASLFAGFLSMLIILLWYFPMASSREVVKVGGVMTLLLGWLSGPVFYGFMSSREFSK